MEVQKVSITLPWDVYADLCFLAGDTDTNLKELIVSLLARCAQQMPKGGPSQSPPSFDFLIADHGRSKDGAREFVRKFLIIGNEKEGKINRSWIYRTYKPWAIKAGYIPLSNQKFYRYLEEIPHVSACRIHGGIRAFSGLAWADD